MKTALLSWLILIALFSEAGIGAEHPVSKQSAKYQIAVYYFPNWHIDPINEAKQGKGWTEWEVLKRAKPQFPGHNQPRVPLWGYRDESDPKEMARSIDAMADHGITAVLFDWYRFDNGGVLDGALRRGFLQAPNRDRLQFSLMWANEDSEENQLGEKQLGAVSRPTFDRLSREAVNEYFAQPNYWKIDGQPYFSIYYLHDLIKGLGGLEQTRDALESFRSRTKAAGFPGLHVNVVGFGLTEAMKLAMGQPTTSGRTIQNEADLITYLKVDSVTWYTWAHVAEPARPTERYDHWAARSVALWSSWQHDVQVPFHPNISLGWDGSPRNYGDGIVVDNSPAVVRKYLEQAKRYLDRQPPERRILTISSWNEWTEEGTLEPDTKWGLAYLEAVRQVFGSTPPSVVHR